MVGQKVVRPPSVGTAESIEASLGLTYGQRVWVQDGLASLGYDVGVADGVFGRRTRAGIRAYQKAKGLPETGYLTGEQSEGLMALGEARRMRQPVESGGITFTPERPSTVIWGTDDAVVTRDKSYSPTVILTSPPVYPSNSPVHTVDPVNPVRYSRLCGSDIVISQEEVAAKSGEHQPSLQRRTGVEGRCKFSLTTDSHKSLQEAVKWLSSDPFTVCDASDECRAEVYVSRSYRRRACVRLVNIEEDGTKVFTPNPGCR